jgi:sialidase-1
VSKLVQQIEKVCLMSNIEILGSGQIYANPKPHLRSRQTVFPTVVRLRSGELLAAFTVGEAFESADGHTELARSRDEGRNWEWLGPLPAGRTPHPTSESGRLSRTPDGTILCFGPRFDRSDPERPIGNAETNGLLESEGVLYRSTDDGRTWTEPQVIPMSVPGPHEIASPICVLGDGRWLAPFSTWRPWNGVKRTPERALAMVSYDQGATWPETITTFEDPNDKIVYWEQRIIEIGGGRLLAVAWAHDHGSGNDLANQFAVAEDGRTFSPPRSTGLPGQTCTPYWLGEDRLLCVYNRRHGEPGIRAALVRFSPEGWRTETDTLVWGQSIPSHQGAKSIIGAVNHFRFGFPGLFHLGGEDFLSTYWCMEDAQLVAGWTRLRIG